MVIKLKQCVCSPLKIKGFKGILNDKMWYLYTSCTQNGSVKYFVSLEINTSLLVRIKI